jgi:NitT/TauT family transport system substrate-binding protein
MRRIAATGVAVVLAMLAIAGEARAAESLRIGVLKFGTVSWELDVIRQHGFDAAEGFVVEPVELASTPATLVALQAGSVDAVVSDWFWVSRQRAGGADWTFFPFSTAVGALLAAPQSPVHSLADLKGRRLGIAGSAVDKSWLILRAAAQSLNGLDLERDTDKSFGAPPLLDEELKAGRLDAVLTYWPFAARLEAGGMRRIMSVDDALHTLGFESAIPMVGYVVAGHWAAEHRPLVLGFVRASRRAEELLAASDEEWTRIAPRTGAHDAAELQKLRDAYRVGIPRHWGDQERRDAERLYALLAKAGGEALAGPAPRLEPGTFLDDVRY